MEMQCLNIYVAASDAEKLSMNTIEGPRGEGGSSEISYIWQKIYV